MAQDPIIREIELQLDLIKHSANEAIRRINLKGDNLSENDKLSIKKHFELIQKSVSDLEDYIKQL